MKDKKYQMYLDLLPIKTKRLIAIKTTINDVDLLLKMDKQELTQKYLGGIKNNTKEERIEFLRKKEKSSSLTICLQDGTKIGFVGLSIDDNNNATIGYIFDNDYWNNGYCTEICRELINIAFNKLDLNNVFADTIKGNISSQKVLEKIGFIYQDSTIKNNVVFLNYKISKKN